MEEPAEETMDSPNRSLPNKPLVEAIFELKWQPTAESLGNSAPSLLMGRLYEHLKDEYPAVEELPAALIPEQLAYHVVQRRFRANVGGWPLVQLGPGIFTINEATNYSWSEFGGRCVKAVNHLTELTSFPDALPVTLSLRYVNSITFDHRTEDVLEFLKDKFGVTITFPTPLLRYSSRRASSNFNWHYALQLDSLPGDGIVRFATGMREGQPILVWEIIIVSHRIPASRVRDAFADWLNQAHEVAEHWFFALIEGELLRRFVGE